MWDKLKKNNELHGVIIAVLLIILLTWLFYYQKNELQMNNLTIAIIYAAGGVFLRLLMFCTKRVKSNIATKLTGVLKVLSYFLLGFAWLALINAI